MTTTPLVDEVDWARLFHAYGVASDTPGHLRCLVSADDAAFDAGLDHLYGAVLHQGTVYPATAPALRAVAGLLGDPVLRRRDGDGRSRLAALLGWIDAVGDSASWHEDTREPDAVEPTAEEIDAFYHAMAADDESVWGSELSEYLWARSITVLPAACGAALALVSTLLSDEDEAVRLAALDAYVRLAAVQPDRVTAAGPLAAAMDIASGRDERAVLVLGLGDLDADTARWLSDDDPAIRACAALPLTSSPAATAVLIEALHDPLAADEWFTRRPSRFGMRVHFGLVANLLARDAGLAEIVPACLPVLRVAQGKLWSDMTWGPILLRAFPGVEFRPGVRPDPPRDLDEAQKAVLRELAANDALWDDGDGNADLARMRVGLPHDRAAVADLAS
ncbi:hypothetical protein [Promicromonospora kroppenstedtii]|uniref:hypothetical protein n=1 Tax=Promicromonospora kroppenstedtii TaxID=440482 RepID=UPI0006860B18|nr:hypothetical protein [Promicromonospora kroppenstedtii]